MWNKKLALGRQLIWVFQPIRWWYFYKMVAIAKVVELEAQRRVTWEITALPGFYARHTYQVTDLGNGRSRFGSWEQAMGWGFRLMKWFWIPHFVFVKDRSLEGVLNLNEIYRQTGGIDARALPRKSYAPFLMGIFGMVLLLVVGTWFYVPYVRLTSTQLAPGVYAVFGGGGNSLVVKGGRTILLVDTKFPPASASLRTWTVRNVGLPTIIVNTHFHYDHTYGNIGYPGARIGGSQECSRSDVTSGCQLLEPALERRAIRRRPG